MYDGDAALTVTSPTFDVTPAAAVTVVTERGPLETADVEAIVATHRERSEWLEDA